MMIVEQMRVGPMAVFTYIVGCEQEKEGLIIDPGGSESKIVSKAQDMGLTIRYAYEKVSQEKNFPIGKKNVLFLLTVSGLGTCNHLCLKH